MEQFWEYVEANPAQFKLPARAGRAGLSRVLALVARHALPAMPYRLLHGHVQNVRKHGDKDNPINVSITSILYENFA